MQDFTTQMRLIREFGLIEEVRHPIVRVSGLPGAKINEIILFEDGSLGQVFLVEKELCQILVFSKEPQAPGMKVTRTDNFLSVPVGGELLGRTIDPLGTFLLQEEATPKPKEERLLDQVPLGIGRRARITRPFLTGVTLVDMMIPLGYGQKQLIVGDRKSGKTSFILTAIKNQIQAGTIAIYVGIGKRKSDIKKIHDYFQMENIADHVVMVVTTSDDSPSLIYLTPFSAMTVAEYFRDAGKNVLIVLDDLSSHAQFYREISLVAERFPGRESYPGDIFYTHARLLERAGNFRQANGDVSITALPVAEVVEGDLAGFISTNLMGMTDGHIFFDSNIFYKGRRPSINIPLSVTRVGKQVQSDLLKSINREINAFLALYERMQNLSHFGAELSDTVKHILTTGDVVYSFFEQQFPIVTPLQVELVLFALLWLRFVEAETPDKISEYRSYLVRVYQDESVRVLFDELLSVRTFNQFLGNVSKKRDTLFALWKTNKNS